VGDLIVHQIFVLFAAWNLVAHPTFREVPGSRRSARRDAVLEKFKQGQYCVNGPFALNKTVTASTRAAAVTGN